MEALVLNEFHAEMVASRRKFMVLAAVMATQLIVFSFWLYRSQDPFNSFYASAIWKASSTNKIFCMILTQPKNLESRAKVVYETWAHKCDYHRFISVIPNWYNNSSRLSLRPREIELNYTVLQPDGLTSETYRNLTKKVLLSIKEIDKRFAGKFDWFLKVDDDTFVFVDNLREFVKTKNPSDPHTYGYNFKVIVENGYHSGGAGYLLTRESFTRVSRAIKDDFKACPDTGVEDVDMGRCMRRLNITPDRSEDDCGHERFHPLSMRSHVFGDFPGWLRGYAENPLKTGEDCCSNQVISFHYVSTDDMYKMADYLKTNPNKLKFRHMMHQLAPTTQPKPPTTTTTTTTTSKTTTAAKSTSRSTLYSALALAISTQSFNLTDKH